VVCHDSIVRQVLLVLFWLWVLVALGVYAYRIYRRAVRGPKAEQEKGKTPKAESSNPFGEMMGKMSKDPALRDAMKAQTRGQVDYLYRDLMDMLELPPDKRDSLTKLLVERTSAGAELGMSLMSGKKLSPEEMKAQSEAILKQTQESDKQLKELLGEADYQKFDRFEKSQPERMQLNTLTSQMKEAGLPLTPESEDQLMDAMYRDERVVADRTVDSHVKKLRRKIAEVVPDEELIHSVYGVGYQYEDRRQQETGRHIPAAPGSV